MRLTSPWVLRAQVLCAHLTLPVCKVRPDPSLAYLPRCIPTVPWPCQLVARCCDQPPLPNASCGQDSGAQTWGWGSWWPVALIRTGLRESSSQASSEPAGTGYRKGLPAPARAAVIHSHRMTEQTALPSRSARWAPAVSRDWGGDRADRPLL